MTQLTAKDLNDLTQLEAIISSGEQTFLKVGLAVEEIRSRRLYLKDYTSFEEYCSKRWNWTRQRMHQIISSAEIVNSLPSYCQPLVDTERTARAIKKVPAESRERVITEAAAAGKVTSKTISDIAASISEPPAAEPEPEPEEPKLTPDQTGYPIPAKQMAIWNRRDEVSVMLAKLSDVRGQLRKIDNDILYNRISVQSVIELLNNAYAELKGAMPYAVCPYCQGQTPENCRSCLGIGFLGKFHWDTIVPAELKTIREKMCHG